MVSKVVRQGGKLVGETLMIGVIVLIIIIIATTKPGEAHKLEQCLHNKPRQVGQWNGLCSSLARAELCSGEQYSRLIAGTLRLPREST